MVSVSRLLEYMQRNNIPFEVTFELTRRCNLSCIHCYQDMLPGEELSATTIRSILVQLADSGTFRLAFTGGEPTCRTDLAMILKQAKNIGFDITLFTNGTLITDELAGVLNGCRVEVSMLGATKPTYESITRVKGSFKRVMKGIRKLRSAGGIRLKLKTPVMKENIHEIREIAAMADDMGVEFGFNALIFGRMSGDQSPLDHAIDDAQLEAIEAFELEYRQNDPAMIQFLDTLTSPRENACDLDMLLCGAGRRIANISPEGVVHPCVALQSPVGDLRHESWEHIWTNSQLLKDIRSIRAEDFRECSGCKYFASCTRCMGISRYYDKQGDLTKKTPPMCRFLRIIDKLRAGSKSRKSSPLDGCSDNGETTKVFSNVSERNMCSEASPCPSDGVGGDKI